MGEGFEHGFEPLANRTDAHAKAVHGTNPQNLIENIVRQKIYEHMYWKEDCFALSADTLVKKAVDLRCVGGTFGGQRKPTRFLCLVLKLLQLQPDMDVVVELIENDSFKYVRVLAAFYLRLVGSPLDVYTHLEPLLRDRRRIRIANAEGSFSLSHVDESVWAMLSGDALFDTALPRIPYKHTLVNAGRMRRRQSTMEEAFQTGLKDEEGADANAEAKVGGMAAGASRESLDVTEANALRASLGLKPLRP